MVNKSELAKQAGIAKFDNSQPLLMQILSAYNSGQKGNSSELQYSGGKAAQPAGFAREEVKKIEPLSYKGLPDEQKISKAAPQRDSTDKHLAKANNLLAELDREEKSGFNLG